MIQDKLPTQNNYQWLRKDPDQLRGFVHVDFIPASNILRRLCIIQGHPPKPQEVTDETEGLTQASRRTDVPTWCQLEGRNHALKF